MSKSDKKPTEPEIVKGMRWAIEEGELIRQAKKTHQILGQDLNKLIFGPTENKKRKPSKDKIQLAKENLQKFIKEGIKKRKIILKNKGPRPKNFEDYIFRFSGVSSYLEDEIFIKKSNFISYLEKERFLITHPLKNWLQENKREMDLVVKSIRRRLELSHNLTDADYDGVRGMPPDWMPEPLKREFHFTRGALFEIRKPEELRTSKNEARFSPGELLKYMEQRTALPRKGWGWLTPIPGSMVDKIDSLIYIKSIADLGKTNGIKAYLGQGGAEVFRGICNIERQRQAAKKPRQDGLTSFIFELLKKKPNLSSEQILDEIKRNEYIDPIGMVSEDIIEFQNPPSWGKACDECEISALPYRIKKIKAKIKKS